MAKLSCTKEEFEQIRAFYETFRRLTEQPDKVADFEYEKQKLLYDVKKLWPRIDQLCKQSGISLERVKSEEGSAEAARRFAQHMSGKKNVPKPEFQPPGKELITLALVKSEIDHCQKPGGPDQSALFPKNLATEFVAKIKLPAHAERTKKIRQILAPLLARLHEYLGEEIGPQASKKTPAETGRKATPGKCRRIIGWIFRKTSHFICAIIVTVIATVIAAIIVDIIADFGWLERIKRLFTR